MAQRSPESISPEPDSHADLPTTHWSVIVPAGGPAGSETSTALNRLCQIYWHPIYALIRRSGYDSHAAKDLTQDFIIHLLETNFVRKADRSVGRFRSFLSVSLKNFLEDQRRKAKAVKRGGQVEKISIDEAEAEASYNNLPRQESDPTKLFDRAWADTVIQQSRDALRADYLRRNKLPVYEALAPFLAGETIPEKYADLANGLKITPENLQVALSRMRDRFGGLLRKVIGLTVSNPADIDDEIRYLLAAWSSTDSGGARPKA